ncbi:Uncharacterised protein [Mycobacterium tuberculosis]|nr:Uncharacterised protein [Mycobacterium tuberculosis]
MIVGATLLMVRNGTGAPAMAASSVKISWSIAERPWPPYSPWTELSASRRSGVINVAKYERSSRRSSSCCGV